MTGIARRGNPHVNFNKTTPLMGTYLHVDRWETNLFKVVKKFQKVYSFVARTTECKRSVGQNKFWPMYFWIWCVSWWSPEGWGWRGRRAQNKWGPERVRLRGLDGDISRFCFSVPPTFSLFLSLFWVSREILVVFEAPQNVHG